MDSAPFELVLLKSTVGLAALVMTRIKSPGLPFFAPNLNVLLSEPIDTQSPDVVEAVVLLP